MEGPRGTEAYQTLVWRPNISTLHSVRLLDEDA